MHAKLKSYFISAYTTLLAVCSIHALYMLYEMGWQSAWFGLVIAVVPSLLFFVRLFADPIARTSAKLSYMPVSATLGSILALLLADGTVQTSYALVYGLGLALGGSLIYVNWYSRLGRQANAALMPGHTLPSFTLKIIDKQHSKTITWQSNELIGKPALLLFFRGNWCPLCMAQIKEIASMYRQLENMGVGIYLVSPQPENHAQSLAKRYDLGFNFMFDEHGQAAKTLGIFASHGTPRGLEILGYESDTVMPTAILTDAQGKIIFCDQTDNYRVRPEPETFLRVFHEHGIHAAS